MISANESSGLEAFRDALSGTVIARLTPETKKREKAVKGRKNEIKPVVRDANGEGNGLDDAAELSDFVEVRQDEPRQYRTPF
jgi:hypothetical protein